MVKPPARMQSVAVLIDESVLCSEGNTRVDHNALDSLLDDVSHLWAEQLRCTIVVTGESTLGRIRCGTLRSVPRPRRDDVWAAVGRSLLDSWITTGLGERGLRTGSLHLTRASFAQRGSYGAVRDCLRGLEANDTVPVVWDNGWVREGPTAYGFGYVDQLMAMIAGQAGAQMGVVGLEQPPQFESDDLDPASGRVSLDRLDAAVRDGTAGITYPPRRRFESIMAAARLLGALDIPLMVAGLKGPNALAGSLRGEETQLIIESDATGARRDGVKRWLSAGAIPQGVIVVSPYAATQLSDEADRASLLAAGVVDTSGTYKEDDVVALEDESHRLIGYGIAKYGSQEVAELRGKRNVIVVHADRFFGVGLQDLVQTENETPDDSLVGN